MARGEIHIQLAVNFSKDPKVRALTRYARDARGCRDLYVQMLCYCKENLTDGFVPFEEIGVLVYPDTPKAGKRDADRLVEVGLAEVVEGGYRLPGFLKRNKSKAQVDEVSAAKAAAGRKGGKRSGEVRRNEASTKHSASFDEAEAKQGASFWLNTEDRGHRSEDKGHAPPYPPAAANAEQTVAVGPPSAGARLSDSQAQGSNRRHAAARSTILGNSLLDEHLKACPVQPPRKVKQRTGEAIDALLDEGIDPDRIRAGLALMRSRPGKGPGLLADLVHEAATATVTQLHPTGTDGRALPRTGALANVNDLWKR
jgi:hypothetical protein